MKIIIADSSTLITLLDTQNITLIFKLFNEIIITNEVYNEITYKFDYQEQLKPFLTSNQLQIHSAKHQEMYEMLIKRLDKGESESIVLAKELSLPLIIDERKGRNIAKELNIPIIGLIGILLKLLEKNIIQKEEAISIIKQIELNNFRLSKELKILIFEY